MKQLIFIFFLIFVIGASGLYFFESQKRPYQNIILGTQTEESPVINGVETSELIVALTFDDGPSFETSKILGILADAQVKATFFPVANNIWRFETFTQRITTDGHEIGNHSNSHPSWISILSEKKLGQEISIADEKIFDVTGIHPKYYRAPYGLYNQNLFDLSNTLNLKIIGWNVDPEDWRRPGSEKITSRVLEQVQPGSIILLHDGPYTADRRQTTEALPQIIEKLTYLGYRFVTISQLLEYDLKY